MIKSTTEYDMFKKHPSNCEMKEMHVQRLMDSISIHNMLSLRPIMVNSSMQVLDGQHRLESAKRLGVPIFYQVSQAAVDADIILLNVNQKKWFNEDYLNFYCTQGHVEYVKLKEFLKKNSLGLGSFLNFNSEGGHKRAGMSNTFRGGNFIFPDAEKTKRFLSINENTKHVVEFIKERNSSAHACLKSAHFLRALFTFLSLKSVGFQEFIDKLEMKVDSVGPRAGTGGYYQMLGEIYNYKRRQPIDVFEVEE